MSDDTRHTYYRAIPDNRCIFHRRLFTLGIETIQYRNCPRSSASSKAEPAVYLHFPILASPPPPLHLNPTLLCPPLATGYYLLSIPSRLTSGSLPFHHNTRYLATARIVDAFHASRRRRRKRRLGDREENHTYRSAKRFIRA